MGRTFGMIFPSIQTGTKFELYMVVSPTQTLVFTVKRHNVPASGLLNGLMLRMLLQLQVLEV